MIIVFVQCTNGDVTWRQEMRSALEELVSLLKDEHTISSFELYSSGLVQTMLNVLNNVSTDICRPHCGMKHDLELCTGDTSTLQPKPLF